MARPNLKQQILDKGAEFVFENGFTASGVSDITQAAGVPKGSFYNHFQSKEAFGLEILERYFVSSSEKAAASLEDKTLTPKGRLEAYLDLMMRDLETQDWSHGCLIGNFILEASCTSEQIRLRLKSFFADWSGRLAACIAEAQQIGEIRNETDAATLANFFIHAWEGAILRMKVDRDRRALDEYRAVLFASVLA
ncbi:MAG: TetR/AcrR family transcriptional regulator [Beijerinckiaceae bacterium]|nr:TetR/AcrR family transcriptional regulator [Beijerinckiaceae bacterium]